MEALPPDLLRREIFSRLDPQDIVSAGSTCSALRAAADGQDVWFAQWKRLLPQTRRITAISTHVDDRGLRCDPTWDRCGRFYGNGGRHRRARWVQLGRPCTMMHHYDPTTLTVDSMNTWKFRGEIDYKRLVVQTLRDETVSHIYTPGMARRHRKNEHSVCGLEKRLRVLTEEQRCLRGKRDEVIRVAALFDGFLLTPSSRRPGTCS